MDAIGLPSPFGPDLYLRPVSFPRRLLAWALDALFLFLFLIVSGWLLQQVIDLMDWDETHAVLRTATLIAFALPVLLYHPLFEVFNNGQTPGKAITGVRVRDAQGGRVSVGQSLIRWIIRTSDYTLILIVVYVPISIRSESGFEWKLLAAAVLLLVDLWLVNSGHRQRLGDLLARTVVIRTKLEPRLDRTLYRAVEPGYQVRFPEAGRLTDEELNLLLGLSDMMRRSGNEALAERTARKVQSMLGIQSDLPPRELVEVVLKDAYYLGVHGPQTRDERRQTRDDRQAT